MGFDLTKRNFFLLLISFYGLIRTILLHKRRKKEEELSKSIPKNPNPLITFSGAGLLGFYYQGVAAYLQDFYDLTDVRFAGISAGSATAAGLATELPVQASMVFGLRWFKLLRDHKYGCYFLSPSDFIKLLLNISQEFDLPEEKIHEANRKKNYFIGTTNIFKFPFEHKIWNGFKSRKESFYVMSCSMRIFPFFKTIGYYKGNYLLDGGFSKIFTIPNDVNKNKIIKITPSCYLNADIQPNKYDKHTFSALDIFKTPTVKFILYQFKRGYLDGIYAKDKLIRKGLKLKPFKLQNNNLEKYMKFLTSHAEKIFNDKNPMVINDDEMMTPRNEEFASLLTQDISTFDLTALADEQKSIENDKDSNSDHEVDINY